MGEPLPDREGGWRGVHRGDEEAAVVLADFAAIAINNARLFRVLETTTEIGRALGGETDLGRVLALVAERARTLIRADRAELVLVGDDGSNGAPALSASLTFRNRPLGELRVWGGPFGEDAERLLQALAASAAIAVATAQNAAEEALRRSLDASEAERSRWARELHDETLQQLAGLRMLLAGTRRSGDRARIDEALETALERLGTGIGDLRRRSPTCGRRRWMSWGSSPPWRRSRTGCPSWRSTSMSH